MQALYLVGWLIIGKYSIKDFSNSIPDTILRNLSMILTMVKFHVCLGGHWQLTIQNLSENFLKRLCSYNHLFRIHLWVIQFSELLNNDEFLSGPQIHLVFLYRALFLILIGFTYIRFTYITKIKYESLEYKNYQSHWQIVMVKRIFKYFFKYSIFLPSNSGRNKVVLLSWVVPKPGSFSCQPSLSSTL